MMRQATGLLTIDSPARACTTSPPRVAGWLGDQGIGEGLLTLFCRHTSASLLIQENAAPAARHDLERFFARSRPKTPSLRP
jgi:secondary thiamine-phosphate synthase enzyme